jgi:hypothetical protein
MTITTPTLTEFLLARIAEDEASAQESWRDLTGQDCSAWFDAIEAVVVRDSADEVCRLPDGDGHVSQFVARYDPARALADCEAKRRIVKWVNDWPLRPAPPSSVDGLLPLLALPYANHPDFRKEWRP